MYDLPYIALAAAFALIYLPRLIVLREMRKLEGGYNNADPRAQQTHLEGIGRRALAAHLNAFEAFAPFATGVLAAQQRGVNVDLVGGLAAVFVGVRVGYTLAYLTDRATLRSALWGIGVACTAALLVLAIAGRPT
jgi:uncharacterized MAPEG superfamily protein